MYSRQLVTMGFLLVGIVQSSGCTSTPATTSHTCSPGETRTCVGSAACPGAQTCSNDGNSWSSCDCSAGAGTGGQGGAASSAQSTGGASNALGGSSASSGGTQTIDTSTYVLVDDMEGTEAQNGPIVLQLGDNQSRPGYWSDWYSTASPLNTMAPNPFGYAALTTPHTTLEGITSTHAVHLVCSIADLYGYCEMGLWFAESDDRASTSPDAGEASGNVTTRIPCDISKHRGIVFWGRSDIANRVKVMFNNADTDVIGEKCGQGDAAVDQCWDSFSKYITFTNTWQRYEVKFSELTQEGWGYAAATGKFDTTSVYSLDFAVNGPGSATAAAVAVDFWIDDIYFE